jgi:amidase
MSLGFIPYTCKEGFALASTILTMASSPDFRFDPLTTTLTYLRERLDSGSITSVQIVEVYLRQITLYNEQYNAFISLAPEEIVLRAAAKLDQERRSGNVRGLLHGLPIVVKVSQQQCPVTLSLTNVFSKDCITTDPDLGMSTTAGSWAFVGSKAKRNSAVAQRLVDAGMIIVGKGNMTVSESSNMDLTQTEGVYQELCGLKTTYIMPGMYSTRWQRPSRPAP